MFTRARSVVVACCVAAVGAAMLVTAGSAAATTRGYALEGHHLIGTSPYGYRVFTNPHSARPAVLADETLGITRELRRLGVQISYRGWSVPRRNVTGRIYVTSGKRGCHSGSEGATLAVTYFSVVRLHTGHEYIPGSTIYVCPSWLRRTSHRSVDAALHHEFGHAMGLAHYRDRYHGRRQIMYPGLSKHKAGFAAGDRAGLRWLARGAYELGREAVGHGKLDKLSWTWDSAASDWKLTVTGWSVVNSFFRHPTPTVIVRRDGSRVGHGRPTVYRPGVNHRWHVSGEHGFRLDAGYALRGTHNYCVSIKPRPGSRFVRTVGCTSLTY